MVRVIVIAWDGVVNKVTGQMIEIKGLLHEKENTEDINELWATLSELDT